MPARTAIEYRIDFFERRVADDPEDIVAQNRLGNLYLAQMRRTGDHSLIAKAEAAADASLRSVPAPQNASALLLLAQARAASHRFGSARDLLLQLIDLHGEKTEYLAALADAFTELGDYAQAGAAFERLAGREQDIGTLTRLARWDFLNGRSMEGARKLEEALAAARVDPDPDPYVRSWVLWQLGENAFHRGDYVRAEAWYRQGLAARPDSAAILYSLGRLLAGGGNIEGALPLYERAASIDPIPYIVAGLADIHELRGDRRRAVETLANVPVADPLDARHVILIWADHDVNPARALDLARAEWNARQDIYAADALAWAALKAGEIDEAKARINDALKLGTEDARLRFHAGMIARASGQNARAIELLDSALRLNPRFDPKQSIVARNALAELRASPSAR